MNHHDSAVPGQVFRPRQNPRECSTHDGSTHRERAADNTRAAAKKEISFDDCLQLIDRVRQHTPELFEELSDGRDEQQAAIGGFNAVPNKFGRFKILRSLGRGGFGLVFVALDPELEREVALKVPRIETLLNKGSRDRFLREGRLAASLDHANIAAVYEAGSVGSICFIASAYCRGGSLAARFKAVREGRIAKPSWRESAELVKVLAQAIQHAHSRGILHRDLKPENILFDSEGDVAESYSADAARIVDFGLAKSVDTDDGDTRSGAVMGTPAYMSPEQAAGDSDETTRASDVYALGAVLYESLTGRAPLKRESYADTMVALQSQPPIPPQRINPDCPKDLEAICLKCLEKKPESRYGSATELADDLDRLLSGQPVRARRLTRAEEMRRWCTRNPAFAALSATILVLITLLATASTAAALVLADARRETLQSLAAEIEAKDSATKSEDLAQRALFEARLAHVRAGRQSKAVGQRLKAVEVAAKAAAQIPRLRFGADERLLLRNEAIAALSLIDLADDKQWPSNDSFGSVDAMDVSGDRYAYRESSTGNIVIRNMADNRILNTLIPSGESKSAANLHFSPDPKYFALSSVTGKVPRVELWDLESSVVIKAVETTSYQRRAFDFSPDGKRIAVARRDGSVQIIEASSGIVLQSFPGDQAAILLQFSPDGSQLALHQPKQIQLIDSASGDARRTIKVASRATYSLAWSANGSLLAAGHNGSVEIWDVATGATKIQWPHTVVSRISFHPQQQVLATVGGDLQTRFWNVDTGELLLVAPYITTRFSSDGKWLGTKAGRRGVVLGDLYQQLKQPRSPGAISAAGLVSIHKDGQIAATSNRTQTVFWDLMTARVLGVFPATSASGMFSPSGDEFIESDLEGTYRIPITKSVTEQRIEYQFGPRERLADGACGFMAVSQTGDVIACADRYHLRHTTLLNRRNDLAVTLDHPLARWTDVTSDGRLVATGTWRGRDVKVWDAATGKLLRSIPATSAKVAFNPNGNLLAIDQGRSFEVWDVDLSRLVVAPQPKEAGNLDQGGICFSPDGRLLAVVDPHHGVRLLETHNFSEIARLEIPTWNTVESILFAPQSDRLVMAAKNSTNTRAALYAWDLRRIRRAVKELDLDWDGPDYAPVEDRQDVPVAVVFNPPTDES
ncbi:MAG: protein kinase [Planctomycetales bacterium]|nr:protein kinase [Planctomycetales bacterium]